MRPQESSKKLNPLGDIMNLPDAFDQLKNTKHNSSFENLGDWLENNNSKPGKMKSLYKVAASLIFTTLILIACTVPVQHEEEIGFMIKGVSSNTGASMIENMKNAKSVFGRQVVMNYIVIDGFKVGESKVKESTRKAEIILMLPNADAEEASAKKDQLNSIFSFDQVHVIPIEEEVEVPLYVAALSQVNLNFGKSLSEEVIVERFNKTLQENSNVAGKVELTTDKDGNKVVAIVIEDASSNLEIKGVLNEINVNSIQSISVSKDKSGKKVIDINMKEEEINALKLREIKKQEMKMQKEQ